jgi:hypothetical protein
LRDGEGVGQTSKRGAELGCQRPPVCIVQPGRLDPLGRDLAHLFDTEPVGVRYVPILVTQIQAQHRRVVGVDRDEQSSIAHRPKGMLGQRAVPIGDHDVARRTNRQGDAFSGNSQDERRVFGDRDTMVDPLRAENVQRDPDVVGPGADGLARMTRSPEPRV